MLAHEVRFIFAQCKIIRIPTTCLQYWNYCMKKWAQCYGAGNPLSFQMLLNWRTWPGKCQSDSRTHWQSAGDPSPTKKLLVICSRSDCWGWTGARDATRPTWQAPLAPSHLTLLNKWRIFQTPVRLDEEESFKRKSEKGNTGFQYLSSIIPRWARLSRFHQGQSNAINPKCC